MILYDYFRSSTSYRARIALHMKNIAFEIKHIDLVAGEQRGDDYKAHNPQGIVPTLVNGDFELTQSLAILEYLDTNHPEPPLLFGTVEDKAYIRQMALVIACEIHPLNNLRVWKGYVGKKLGADEAQQKEWFEHWTREGFAAYEELLGKMGRMGKFTCGDQVSMADLALVPQLYNARRFDFDLSPFPKICTIERNCMALDFFQKAAPECHPNAPEGLEPIHGPDAPLLKAA